MYPSTNVNKLFKVKRQKCFQPTETSGEECAARFQRDTPEVLVRCILCSHEKGEFHILVEELKQSLRQFKMSFGILAEQLGAHRDARTISL